ncbi:MAG: geranylgeranyl reductase family protein [Syntrophaceae bacterium]|nr:geranylgeranyl reductase family protein [Syntrophaceae bacterium]
MGRDYDVIVVGAGPGGSTAARFCAQAGLKTLLIEKEKLPRYKPCGGCLSVKTVDLLGFDLSSVIENTIYEVKFSYCLEDPFLIQSNQPIAFLVMRNRLDHLLVNKALEKGAEILEGSRATGVKETGDGVEVELANGERLRGEYLIGADGANSVVARSLSLFPLKSKTDGIGLESEIRFQSVANISKEDLRRIHLDFGRIPSGYGWVFPKREGLSIGIGGMFMEKGRVDLRQSYIDFLKGLNYTHDVEAERVIGHLLPSFYDDGQKVSEGRVLLVGDAGHLIDPLTGEGIYYAIRSGMLAAEAIVESKEQGPTPSDHYQRSLSHEIFDNLKWALQFARFVNRFTRLSYRTLKHYPELGYFYLRVLEGKETYQGFVARVKERVKDLLGGRLSEKIKRAMAKI